MHSIEQDHTSSSPSPASAGLSSSTGSSSCGSWSSSLSDIVVKLIYKSFLRKPTEASRVLPSTFFAKRLGVLSAASKQREPKTRNVDAMAHRVPVAGASWRRGLQLARDALAASAVLVAGGHLLLDVLMPQHRPDLFTIHDPNKLKAVFRIMQRMGVPNSEAKRIGVYLGHSNQLYGTKYGYVFDVCVFLQSPEPSVAHLRCTCTPCRHAELTLAL